MSNLSYDKFIKENHENFNEFYSALTIFRLFQGIIFLQSNFQIHRDLKPSNILIDHDFIPYISDFEFILPIKEQMKSSDICSINFADALNQPPEFFENETLSLSSDIYSSGLIVYYILENKDLIKKEKKKSKEIIKSIDYNKLPEIKNGTKRLKSLFYSTVKFDPKERIDIKEIQKLIFEEMKSSFYLDKYFLIETNNEQFSILNQYIYEHIKILNSQSELEEFINHLYDLFLFKLFLKEENFANFHEKFCKEINYSNNILKSLKSIVVFEYKLFEKNNKKFLLYFILNCIQQYYHNDVNIIDFFKELNDPQILLFLGDLYFYGNEFKKNYSIAREFYEKSAYLGNSTSFFKLGEIYKNGLDVDKDIDVALYYYDESSQLKNKDALKILGDLYFAGNMNEFGIEKDIEKALFYYEQLADLNDSNALLHLGSIYYKGFFVPRDLEKAFNFYKRSEKLGNSEAQLHLGDMYFYGEYVPKDENKAIELYSKSALKNNSMAILRLADINLDKKNYVEAKKYLQISLNLGNSYAFVRLGTISMLGLDGKQNIEEAFKYFQIAAEKFNDHLAYLHLGNMYKNGFINNKIDYKKAIECYKKSAENDNPEALVKLGDIYFEGKLVEFNPTESIKYYLKCIQNYKDKDKLFKFKIVSNEITKSYNFNNYIASNKVGLIYLLFYNDIESAKKFLKIAACGELAHAQINYGFLSYLLNNREEAEHFLGKAAKKNISVAEFILGFIREKEGKIDESIQFYIRASNHTNVEIFLFSFHVIDEIFEKSKEFILCFTNLKLVLFYLSKKDNVNAKKFFVRAFFWLMFYESETSNEFTYIGNFDVFSRLDEFLFSIPKFNLKNKFNLDHISQICSQINNNEEKTEKECDIDIIKEGIKEKFDFINKKLSDEKFSFLKDQSYNDNYNNRNDDSDDDEDNNDDDDDEFLFKKYLHCCMNQDNCKRTKKRIEQLFNFILKNNSYHVIIKNLNFIVQKMNMILNEKPNSILFGRI